MVVWSCLGVAVLASAEATAQLKESNWTSQVIQLPPGTIAERPAVAISVALNPDGSTLAIAGDDLSLIHI